MPSLEADESALHALGRAGGPLDDASAEESTDANVGAGWPFFGQFIAHDITADRSPIGHRTDPRQIENFRTPRANLETVYGAGPEGTNYLGIIDADPESFRSVGRSWTPTLPAHEPESFGIADILVPEPG